MCRCLEGLFDTWGTFGYGFNNNLTLGGPTPIGARKANLSDDVLPFMQEVALNEQVQLLTKMSFQMTFNESNLIKEGCRAMSAPADVPADALREYFYSLECRVTRYLPARLAVTCPARQSTSPADSTSTLAQPTT